MKPIVRTEIQGEADWLLLRQRMITATNIAPIMNLSPFKSAYALWEEKLGLREAEKTNERMAEGMLLESKAREFFNKTQESDYEPVVLQHGEIDYLMASLDGMNSNGEILEIKCGQKSHEMAKNGVIPDYYLSQVQCQMLCSNAEWAYYFSYRSDDDNVLLKVDRDNEFIEKMKVEVAVFFRQMMDFIPPPMTHKDYIVKDDRDWRMISHLYNETSSQLDHLKVKQEALRQELINMSGGQSVRGAGITLTKSIRKGNIDYARIDALKSINLDEYRKDKFEVWTIRMDKSE